MKKNGLDLNKKLQMLLNIGYVVRAQELVVHNELDGSIRPTTLKRLISRLILADLSNDLLFELLKEVVQKVNKEGLLTNLYYKIFKETIIDFIIKELYIDPTCFEKIRDKFFNMFKKQISVKVLKTLRKDALMWADIGFLYRISEMLSKEVTKEEIHEIEIYEREHSDFIDRMMEEGEDREKIKIFQKTNRESDLLD